jgi:hypothetical protein
MRSCKVFYRGLSEVCDRPQTGNPPGFQLPDIRDRRQTLHTSRTDRKVDFGR